MLGKTWLYLPFKPSLPCRFLVDAVSPVTVHAKALFVTSPDYAVTKVNLYVYTACPFDELCIVFFYF